MRARCAPWLAMGLWLLGASASLGKTGEVESCASDDCESPFLIGDLDFVDTGDTCDFGSAAAEYSRTCPIGGVSYSGSDAVYEIQLTRGNSVGFRLSSSVADLVLVLGCAKTGQAEGQACGDEACCVASSPDFIGLGQEEIPAANYPAGTYVLYVDSAADAEVDLRCGRFQLEVTGTNPPEPDLSLRIDASADPVVAGTDLTYTLTAVNDSPFSATGVRIRAELPVGTRFVTGSPGCRGDAQGVVGFSRDPLAAYVPYSPSPRFYQQLPRVPAYRNLLGGEIHRERSTGEVVVLGENLLHVVLSHEGGMLGGCGPAAEMRGDGLTYSAIGL